MSGLSKKTVYADRLLSAILGVTEGDLVSYAQVTKGVHQYIKDNDLRNISAKSQPATQQPVQEAKPPSSTNVKPCRDCGAAIPLEAVFCDLCGVSQ